jgi:hypothetical protein
MRKHLYIQTITFTFIFFALMFVSGCYQDVIDVDFSEIDNQVVIEGMITNELTNHTVKISMTSSYSDPYNYPAVTGAEVTVSDNEGNVIMLEESESGIYKSPMMQGVPGRTYTLNVVYDNDTFTAVSYMPQPLKLDSSRFVPSDDYGNYNFKYYFSDDEEVTEQCRFEVYINDYYLRDESFLYNGKYYEGKSIVKDDIYGSNLYSDVIHIDIYSMDETGFNIYSNMRERDENVIEEDEINVGAFFNVTDFHFSNISSGAIGFFSAEAVTKYDIKYSVSNNH